MITGRLSMWTPEWWQTSHLTGQSDSRRIKIKKGIDRKQKSLNSFSVFFLPERRYKVNNNYSKSNKNPIMYASVKMGKGKVSILLRKITKSLSGFRLYLYIYTYIFCGMIYTAPEYIVNY